MKIYIKLIKYPETEKEKNINAADIGSQYYIGLLYSLFIYIVYVYCIDLDIFLYMKSLAYCTLDMCCPPSMNQTMGL